MTKTTENNALIVFVKNPVRGKVKTRLAKSVGAEKALQIYLRLMRHTAKIAIQSELPVCVFYSDMIVSDDQWNFAAIKEQQYGADLGARMYNAFDLVLQRYAQAMIIGSDCGMLTSQHIGRATTMLSYADVAVGPSVDGGYYLLAMKTLLPALFQGIQWSTDTVLPSTLAALLAEQQEFGMLETLRDVDYLADWKALGWEE